MELFFGLYPTESFQTLIKAAQLSEKYGFHGLSTGDIPFGWDYAHTGYVLAQATKKIKISIMVTNPYTRHPLKTAIAAAGLHAAAPERFIFGIGAGSREALIALGYDWIKPVQAVRETIQIVRETLRPQSKYTHPGPMFTGENLTIWPTAPKQFPIMIGCRRPHLLRLAGEMTNGVLLDNVPYSYIDFAKQQIAIGAERTNQDLSKFVYSNITSYSVNEERQEAYDTVKYFIPIDFITISDRELESSGFTPEQIKPIQDAFAAQTHEQHKKAAELVTDDMVKVFSVAGTPEDCIRRIKDAERHGLTEIHLCIPMDPASNPMKVIEMTGEHVLPAFL